MIIIIRFFQVTAVIFSGLAVYLALVHLPRHVDGKVAAAQKTVAIEKEKLGKEVAGLRSATQEKDREVLRAKQSASDAKLDQVKNADRKGFLETQYADLQGLFKSMESDQSDMVLREGVLRDEITKLQTLYSGVEVNRRQMAVAMGRQTEANNKLAGENATLKQALAVKNVAPPSAAPPLVGRVPSIPPVVTRIPNNPPVVASIPSNTPTVSPRGGLAGQFGYVTSFNQGRGEVYVDLGSKHGVREGSELLIRRGDQTIGSVDVQRSVAENAFGILRGENRSPRVGDQVVRIR